MRKGLKEPDLLGEEKGWWGPRDSTVVLKRRLQRGWRVTLHKRIQGEYKEQQVPVTGGEVPHLQVSEKPTQSFTRQPPQGHGEVSITGGFQSVIGQGAK